PGNQLNSYFPNSSNRARHDCATPMAAGMYSNVSMGKGRERPLSASASKPSMSILHNLGVPCCAISMSRVVTSTVSDTRQLTPPKDDSRLTAAIQLSDREDTVGLRGSWRSVAVPGDAPTAAWTSVTFEDRP